MSSGPRSSPDGPLAYLDSSAAAKLVVREDESAAVTRALGQWAGAVSSELLAIEVRRLAVRAGRALEERAREVIERFALYPVSPAVVRRAAVVEPAGLRTLDAIHLATALELMPDIGALFTYDRKLERAADAAGIEVLAPR
ncbi:MAG TPA: type II toxin-antitoxin system VapC family toxin [Solirubrobacteraceae bacterium]|jgi:predicted nucleic acid-binding protein